VGITVGCEVGVGVDVGVNVGADVGMSVGVGVRVGSDTRVGVGVGAVSPAQAAIIRRTASVVTRESAGFMKAPISGHANQRYL
jgi:hypothetical protein